MAVVIRCPTCGDPVMIRGNRWECGWCGDFGSLSSLAPSERAKLARLAAADSPALHWLERGALAAIQGIEALLGSGEDARAAGCRLAVYGMSRALLPAEVRTGERIRLLEEFFRRYPFCDAGQVLAAAKRGVPAYEAEFALTEQNLGFFWEEQLPGLPAAPEWGNWPEWLTASLDGLSQVMSALSGERETDLFDELRDAFEGHWNAFHFRCPDRAALEDMVRRWDFSENEWAVRDWLLAVFPQAAAGREPEELRELTAADLLAETADRDPAAAVDMAALLLEIARDHLGEAEPARAMMEDILWEVCVDERVQPLLLARMKQDDALAARLFQSAYADRPQWSLLAACRRLEEEDLWAKLLDLLAKNPYPHPPVEEY